MKFVDKWLLGVYRRARTVSRQQAETEDSYDKYGSMSKGVASDSSGSSRMIDGNCISFSVFKADGGFVIQYISTEYSGPHIKTTPKLKLVPNGEDLGQAVEHIMTIEGLRA